MEGGGSRNGKPPLGIRSSPLCQEQPSPCPARPVAGAPPSPPGQGPGGNRRVFVVGPAAGTGCRAQPPALPTASRARPGHEPECLVDR